MTSMKCLHTTSEDPNQIYALDYRPDGLKFATAGQDYQVSGPTLMSVRDDEHSSASNLHHRVSQFCLPIQCLLVGLGVRQVRLYDEATKTLQQTFSGDK